MDLVEELYGNGDLGKQELWEMSPFYLFSPKVNFLGFKSIRNAIAGSDRGFFVRNVRNNFLPDKNDADVLEAKREAMNRGIRTLNGLCETHFPEAFPYLVMDQIVHPFDPLEMFTEAREKWIRGKTRDSKSRQGNPEAMLKAYEAVRAWGLGHFVLILDESPEVFHSIKYRPEVKNWFQEHFEFSNPTQVGEKEFSWDTNVGVKVFGTKTEPFRQRAKIYDDWGSLRYDSLLMKMFLKKGFVDRISDNHGVSIVVENDQAVGDLVHHFRYDVRSSAKLEKFDSLNRTDPPAFRCIKFVFRLPIRMVEIPERRRGDTLKRPIEKYMRIPVEVQLIPKQEIDHDLYEKQKFEKVLPLWYPRQIYEPVIRARSAAEKVPLA